MRITLITILILLSFESFSQDEQRKKVIPNRKNHFIGFTAGLGGLGLSLASMSIDAFIVKDINIELGTGFNAGAILNNGRTNYTTITHHHSFSRYSPNWSFFYGFGYANYESTNQVTSYGKEEEGNAFYITTGILLVTRGGFTLKYEMGPGYIVSTETWGYDNSTKNTNRFTKYAGVKLGIHFGGGYSPKPEKPKKNISQKDFIKRQRKTKGKYQNEEIKRTRKHI